MKKVLIASISCVSLLCVFYFTPLSSTFSSSTLDLVSLNVHQLTAELKEREQFEQRIELSNSSDELVYFSAIKTLDAVASPSSMQFFQDAFETGSSWQTTRCNYQRNGYNAVESSQPPYEYKWRYQSQRALRSPVISGRNIYIPGEDGTLYSVDSRTGVFRESMVFGSVIYSVHFADRHLAVISNDGLKVYDRITQRHVWNYDAHNPSIFSFAAYNGRFYYATGHSVLCFNQDTGAMMWKVSGAYTSLILGEDLVFALSSNQVLTAFEFSNGAEKFRIKLEGEVQGAPALRDGLIYLALSSSEQENDSKVICIDQNGVNRWTYPIEKEISTSVSCDQFWVYATTVTGDVLALDRYTGKLHWQQTLLSPIHVPPTISSSHVYIGLNNGQVHALEKDRGESKWHIDFKFPIYSELVLAQGLIYTVDNTGSLVAYGREWEKIVPPMSPENARGFPGNSIATLYWSVSKAEPDLAGYHIYRKTENERDFSFLDKLPKLNQYQDLSVKNGLRYHYVVRSYDLYGNESSNSSQIAITPSENAPPIWIEFSPNNGVIKPKDQSSILLKIRSLTLPPGSYKGYVYFIVYGSSVIDDLLKLEITLNVQQGDSDQAFSPVIRGIQSSDSRIQFSWEGTEDAVKYQIYRSQVSKSQYQMIRELNASILSFQDDSVKNGQRYFYALKAINSKGTLSEFSPEATAIPQALPLHVDLNDHAVLYEAILNLKGTCDPKAKISINNYPVEMVQEGIFSSSVGIPVGRSDIVVKAYDTQGNSQERHIPVSYMPSVLQVQLRVDDPVVEVNRMRWPYLLDAPPIIRDQRTFVPLRFLGEIIGATVAWDAIERKVTYRFQNTQVELWIGQKQIKINGVLQEIDVAPFIQNGRTLVPLRFITEPMGAKIQWDAQNRIILLLFEFK